MNKANEAYKEHIKKWDVEVAQYKERVRNMSSFEIQYDGLPPKPKVTDRQSFFDGWDAAMKHQQKGNINNIEVTNYGDPKPRVIVVDNTPRPRHKPMLK